MSGRLSGLVLVVLLLINVQRSHAGFVAVLQVTDPSIGQLVNISNLTYVFRPGEIVYLSGRASFDTSGSPIVRYRFDFGDGSLPTVISNQTIIAHTYSSVGTYNVVLTVTNANNQTATDSGQIRVAEASATAAPGPSSLVMALLGAISVIAVAALRSRRRLSNGPMIESAQAQ